MSFFAKILKTPYVQTHVLSAQRHLRQASGSLGFAVPGGFLVLWCAWPAIGDEKKSSLGLPVAEPNPAFVTHTKYELSAIDAMPSVKA
jgi:hypothetical protein